MFKVTSLLLTFVGIFGLTSGQQYNEPLDQYVNYNDGMYSYIDTGGRYSGINEGGRWNAYVLNMTSQQWLNSTFVNHPIWWHWLIVIVPENLEYTDFATVVGTGGHNSDYNNWPPENEEYFVVARYIATHTKSIIAVLYQIPNEPLVFYNDPTLQSRSEDAIIAWGWHVFSWYPRVFNYNQTYRYQWIVEFAMAKAMVKAMDTIENYLSKTPFNYTITRWACAGASKRGWATWLTAAVDKRIEAFVPIVFDMPNLYNNLHHMWTSYGGWTWAFEDYWVLNLTAEIDEPWFQDLCQASDPYYFFDRYVNKMKLVIDATDDEFFMPDDEFYWWNDLPQPKYFEMVPNAEHSEATGIEQLVPTVSTFLTAFLQQMEFPIFDWYIDYTGNGTITASLTSSNLTAITRVLMYYGRSCGTERRDFRIANLDNPCPCGIESNGYCINLESIWFAEELQQVSNNGEIATYVANLPMSIPTNYWEGFLIGLQYQFFESNNPKSMHKLIYKNKTPSGLQDDGFIGMFDEYGKSVFSTQVSIQPNTFPFPPCSGAGCKGTLV